MTPPTRPDATFAVGDKVTMPNAPFYYVVGQVGVVERAPVRVARAGSVGWDDIGVIGVRFPSGHVVESHYSNFRSAE